MWIWEHGFGLRKLQRSILIKLLQPKGVIDEPNPITAEIKNGNATTFMSSSDGGVMATTLSSLGIFRSTLGEWSSRSGSGAN